MELTRSEMQIMDVFWASEEPLSRSDLLARSEEKSWKDSSVHILLNGLLQKGAIREVGFVKRSKTYGRTFLPNLTREEYFALTVFRIGTSRIWSAWWRPFSSEMTLRLIRWLRLRSL